jgi:hypothetical protein
MKYHPTVDMFGRVGFYLPAIASRNSLRPGWREIGQKGAFFKGLRMKDGNRQMPIRKEMGK